MTNSIPSDSDLQALWQLPLRVGNNPSGDPSNGACLMDAISWLEYGHLGDHPACVSPVLAAYGRRLNDLLPDADRQHLRQFIPLLVGSVDPAAETRRAEYLVWQAIRVFVPCGLRYLGLHGAAEDLAQCPQVLRLADEAAMATAQKVRNASGQNLRAPYWEVYCASRAASGAAINALTGNPPAAALCAARAPANIRTITDAIINPAIGALYGAILLGHHGHSEARQHWAQRREEFETAAAAEDRSFAPAMG